jgi:hypothetical protein
MMASPSGHASCPCGGGCATGPCCCQ